MTQYQQAQLDALKWRRHYHEAASTAFEILIHTNASPEEKQRWYRRTVGHANEAYRYGAKYHRLLVIANLMSK
jgi:hypothetical protein